jgi:hypothetical protein
MLRFAAVVGVVLIAAPAAADILDAVRVENCAPHEELNRVMVCDVTNLTQVAIAEIRFAHKYTQKDRTIPWVDTGPNSPRWTKVIEGGIEPSETVSLWLEMPSVSDRADLTLLEFSILPVLAINAKGEVLE